MMNKQDLIETLNEVIDIGEEGACCIGQHQANKENALKDIRAFVCMNTEHAESEKITEEDITGSYWAHIVTDKERKDKDSNFFELDEDIEFYIDHKESDNDVPVWYHDPNWM